MARSRAARSGSVSESATRESGVRCGAAPLCPTHVAPPGPPRTKGSRCTEPCSILAMTGLVWMAPVLSRALGFWLGVRALFVLWSAITNPGADPVPVGFESFLFVVIVLGAFVAEIARRRERVFWENLGVSMPMLLGVALVPVAIAEGVLRWVR